MIACRVLLVCLVPFFFHSAVALPGGSSIEAGVERSVPEKPDGDDEIREVLFLEILGPWIADKSETRSFYLAVDKNKDPSDALLKRLKRKWSNLRKYSESKLSDRSLVISRTSGESGVRFSISKIKRISKFHVEAEAGSYVGNMSSDGCTFTLKQEKGTWKIISKKLCFIS